mmetsp:Transcript_18787/g.28150  ORF Transcript_18787/g.28150 Transcript_18787/m.28150 type:complete len:238 (+) Transcript_18787:391-1104(+)
MALTLNFLSFSVPDKSLSATSNKPRCWKLGTSEADEALSRGGNVKVVHFVRHGQGEHNVRNKLASKVVNCGNMDIFDARLTSQGEAEAAALQGITKSLSPDVIFVSPLRRTLQTATLGFKYVSAPMIAVESLREVYGCTAERRRPISISSSEFPRVDFSGVEDSDPYGTALLETPSHLVERELDFLEFLKTREEKNIGVVTHSLWLLSLFRDSLDCDDEEIKRFFKTAELKSVVIEF